MPIMEYSGYGHIAFTNYDVLLFDCAQNGDSDAYSILFERYIDSILSKYLHDTRMEYTDLRQAVYSYLWFTLRF